MHCHWRLGIAIGARSTRHHDPASAIGALGIRHPRTADVLLRLHEGRAYRPVKLSVSHAFYTYQYSSQVRWSRTRGPDRRVRAQQYSLYTARTADTHTHSAHQTSQRIGPRTLCVSVDRTGKPYEHPARVTPTSLTILMLGHSIHTPLSPLAGDSDRSFSTPVEPRCATRHPCPWTPQTPHSSQPTAHVTVPRSDEATAVTPMHLVRRVASVRMPPSMCLLHGKLRRGPSAHRASKQCASERVSNGRSQSSMLSRHDSTSSSQRGSAAPSPGSSALVAAIAALILESFSLISRSLSAVSVPTSAAASTRFADAGAHAAPAFSSINDGRDAASLAVALRVASRVVILAPPDARGWAAEAASDLRSARRARSEPAAAYTLACLGHPNGIEVSLIGGEECLEVLSQGSPSVW